MLHINQRYDCTKSTVQISPNVGEKMGQEQTPLTFGMDLDKYKNTADAVGMSLIMQLCHHQLEY